MTLWLAKLFQRITDYFIARAERATRISNPRQAIIDQLSRTEPLSGAQLAKLTGLGSGRLYIALGVLEGNEKISGEWLPGSFPRRRVYRVRK